MKLWNYEQAIETMTKNKQQNNNNNNNNNKKKQLQP